MKKIIIIIVIIIVFIGIGISIFSFKHKNTTSSTRIKSTNTSIAKDNLSKSKNHTTSKDETAISTTNATDNNINTPNTFNSSNTNQSIKANNSKNTISSNSNSITTNTYAPQIADTTSSISNTVLSQTSYNELYKRFEQEINSIVNNNYDIKNINKITDNYLSTHFSPVAAVNMSNVPISDLNNGNYNFHYTKNSQLPNPSNPNKMPFSIPLNIYKSSLNGYLIFTITN